MGETVMDNLEADATRLRWLIEDYRRFKIWFDAQVNEEMTMQLIRKWKETLKEKFMQAKVGDLMAFTYWARVERVYEDELYVTDVDNGNTFSVKGRVLIDVSKSADFFEKEEKVTRTKLAEMLIEAKNVPFTVCFNKQDGEERILRGRLLFHEALLGRSSVEDLDIKTGSRLRLVDHRTLKWLILNEVKYSVK